MEDSGAGRVPVFLFAVFVALWGFLRRNMPPFPPSATPDQVKAHFHEFRLPLLIAIERLPSR